MKYIYIILICLYLSCSKKDDLELEIINTNLKSLNIEINKYEDFVLSDKIHNESKSILTYKLINNSDKTYYLNLDSFNENLDKSSIKTDRVFVRIFDMSLQTVYPKAKSLDGYLVQHNMDEMMFLNRTPRFFFFFKQKFCNTSK